MSFRTSEEDIISNVEKLFSTGFISFKKHRYKSNFFSFFSKKYPEIIKNPFLELIQRPPKELSNRDFYFLTYSYFILGHIEKKNQNPDQAIEYYKQIILLTEKRHSQKEHHKMRGKAFFALGYIYYVHKNATSGQDDQDPEFYLKKAFEIFSENLEAFYKDKYKEQRLHILKKCLKCLYLINELYENIDDPEIVEKPSINIRREKTPISKETIVNLVEEFQEEYPELAKEKTYKLSRSP